jgi:uncharacterized protein (DUF58 family)
MIPAAVMKELRYIEVYTTKKIRNLRAGAYTSPLRGDGFDFDDHRPYRPGDDVRRIDWNVTARMNAPYLRQTHAEREQNMVIAVDLSKSMAQGSRGYSKKEAMTFITGSLVFSAHADQINTGFLAFTDRVLAWSPPRRTGARAWSILNDLWALDPRPAATAIIPAVQHLLGALRHMSVVMLVSDFLTQEDLFGHDALRMLAARHDVVGVVVEDPSETALPATAGYVRVKDLESGRGFAVGLTNRTRRAFAASVAERRAALVRSFYTVPMDHTFVRTDEPVVEPLLHLFARRRMK